MEKSANGGLRWVLPSEAARLIGVSSGYVRALVDAGRLPAKRGPIGIRLIERTAVERFAQERAKRQFGEAHRKIVAR